MEGGSHLDFYENETYPFRDSVSVEIPLDLGRPAIFMSGVGRPRPGQTRPGETKPTGGQSSHCPRHHGPGGVDARNGGKYTRGLRGRAGDGYGAPSHDYMGKVPGHAGTWRKYLAAQGTYPGAGVRQRVGATPGPGIRRTWEGTWASPAALLPCPALPALDGIPIPSAHSPIHPPSARPPTHPHHHHPWTDPWDHDASLPLPAYSAVHTGTQTSRVPLFPSLAPPPWNPSVCCQVGESACFHSFSIPPIRACHDLP